jgi:amino acid transporter
MLLKRLLVGLPLKTTEAVHERLSKRLALAVFSSDPLSSVAYASEEILLVLVLAGAAAVVWSIPVSMIIVLLLAILTMSYREIIFEYPYGGGAYTVAKSNIGVLPGLTAAAALIIDYVLTVAVSVAAGIAAVTSALPSLYSHREALGILAIVILVVGNLRGLRESGRLFSVPTYIFIGSILLMLGAGCYQLLSGRTMPAAAHAPEAVEGVSLFLLLRAFSSGCTALTGVETISNGVSTFKRPESKNAATTMAGMAVILGVMFLGISTLAYRYGVLPREEETVVSQIARLTFGEGALYYLVQAATMAILILAANSALNGFPRLACILAEDGYMPHQMTSRGDRLVFSNGIVILGVVACLLLIVFRGDTHALIPLYAVGVFLSFTLSQAGMVRHWFAKRSRHWRKRLVINGLGAVATGLATLVIASTKFVHGAWIVVALLPVLVMWFLAVHRHYAAVQDQVSLERDHRPAQPRKNLVIIPISGVNRAVIRAVDYARSHAADIRAVLVDVDREDTARVQIQWAQWGCGVHLVVLPSPYRSVLGSLLDYIEMLLEKNPEGWVTVVLPEILPAKWWQHILHGQRALMLKAALLFKERVIVIDVPYHLER